MVKPGRLEETGLDGAGAAEGDVSAGEARVTVGEDLGLVGLEHLLGGVAVETPDVDVVELLVHGWGAGEEEMRVAQDTVSTQHPCRHTARCRVHAGSQEKKLAKPRSAPLHSSRCAPAPLSARGPTGPGQPSSATTSCHRRPRRPDDPRRTPQAGG